MGRINIGSSTHNIYTRKAQCNPLPHLLGVAMASNIGSAATLLGNPQNILVGSLSGMSFSSYFLVASPVALIGLSATYVAISYYCRQELAGNFITPTTNTYQYSYVFDRHRDC